MEKKGNILVCGNVGMMGSHCTDYLIENYGKKYVIHGVDDLSGCYPENLNPKCKFMQMDLRNEADVKEYFMRYFKKDGLDYLIHFTSAAHEIRSFFTPIENMSRNDQAFRNTLTYAVECGVKHVVFFSSMSRYGSGVVKDGNGDIFIEQKPPFREHYIPFPEDPYACAKFNSENMLRAFSNVHALTYTIWVPHNCFSPRQYVDPYRNVIAIWMNLILMDKDCVVYGTGNQRRAISWVNDFNPIICESIFNKDTHGQVINIGGDEEKSLNEWYELVRKVSGKGKEAIHLDPRPGEVFHAYCNHDKAQKLTGFENKTKVEDAIAEMWEYFKNKGPRIFNYLDSFEINSEKIPVTWKKRLF